MECVLTKEELQERLAHWQKVLRLQDWDVKVVVVRASQMECGGNAGENTWQLSTKTALIKLCDPVDWPEDTRWEQDMEETLVHELLHLHMALFQPEHDTLEHAMMEQAICCIATGLVALHRQAQRHGYKLPESCPTGR